MSNTAIDQKPTGGARGKLLDQLMASAGRGLLRFATFSGLVITTNIKDMERGLFESGPLTVSPGTVRGQETLPVPGWQIQNRHFSCIYLRSEVEVAGKKQLRESLNMIRRDLSGGVIIYSTDGVPVRGVINALPKVYFHPNEVEVFGRMLARVQEIVAAFQAERREEN